MKNLNQEETHLIETLTQETSIYFTESEINCVLIGYYKGKSTGVEMASEIMDKSFRNTKSKSI